MRRFWDRVSIATDGDCWEWTGSRRRFGYGRTKVCGETVTTHRLAYQLEVGPIPTGMMILHTCDNPPCCNPAHLYAGTAAQNMADKVSRGRHNAARGGRHWMSKLDEEKATFAMARLLAGETQKSVADSFGVAAQTIHHIWRGDTWGHLFD